MEPSEIEKCPICGKQVTPLSILTQHVEECLLRSNKMSTRAKNSSPKNIDHASDSFFSPLSSKKSLKKTQKSPQNDPKRPACFLAGKSDVSPPEKKLRLDEPKHEASAFFQPFKDNVKKDKQSIQTSADNSKEAKKMAETKHVEKSPSNPVKPVSLLGKPASLDAIIPKGKTSKKGLFTPLAEQMRPCGLDDYVGQSKVVGENCLLRSLLEDNEVPSMILWGPPGCGKVLLKIVV